MDIRRKIIDISSIGIADILSAGIAGIFWFYIASMLGPENYGEITYLLSIATLVFGLALLGSNYTLMVYSAKKIPIQSTLFLLSSVIGFVAAITIFFFFADLGLSVIILGYIVLALVTADLLGKKLYKTYSKYVIIQKILMVILGIGLYYVMKEPGILLGIGLSYLPLIKEMISRFKENKINFKLVIEKKNFILILFIMVVIILSMITTSGVTGYGYGKPDTVKNQEILQYSKFLIYDLDGKLFWSKGEPAH